MIFFHSQISIHDECIQIQSYTQIHTSQSINKSQIQSVTFQNATLVYMYIYKFHITTYYYQFVAHNIYVQIWFLSNSKTQSDRPTERTLAKSDDDERMAKPQKWRWRRMTVNRWHSLPEGERLMTLVTWTLTRGWMTKRLLIVCCDDLHDKSSRNEDDCGDGCKLRYRLRWWWWTMAEDDHQKPVEATTGTLPVGWSVTGWLLGATGWPLGCYRMTAEAPL